MNKFALLACLLCGLGASCSQRETSANNSANNRSAVSGCDDFAVNNVGCQTYCEDAEHLVQVADDRGCAALRFTCSAEEPCCNGLCAGKR